MIAGIVPHPTPLSTSSSLPAAPKHPINGAALHPAIASPALTSFLVLAYSPPDTSFLHGDEMTEDRTKQARKPAARPELCIISRAGEELAADALGITDFQSWGCNDYVLAEVGDTDTADEGRSYVVLSPRDVVIVKPRDRRDHIAWLVERKRYEEALEDIERNGDADVISEEGETLVTASEIGQRYIEHLVSEG